MNEARVRVIEYLRGWARRHFGKTIFWRTASVAAGEIERILLAPPAPTHRHKKRGEDAVLIGYGRMQAEGWVDLSRAVSPPEDPNPTPVDMREVAIYRSVDDGSLWVRPREEFGDGRFEVLP